MSIPVDSFPPDRNSLNISENIAPIHTPDVGGNANNFPPVPPDNHSISSNGSHSTPLLTIRESTNESEEPNLEDAQKQMNDLNEWLTNSPAARVLENKPSLGMKVLMGILKGGASTVRGISPLLPPLALLGFFFLINLSTMGTINILIVTAAVMGPATMYMGVSRLCKLADEIASRSKANQEELKKNEALERARSSSIE